MNDEASNFCNEYEDLKRIMKELLFNGADRSIEARFNLNLIDNNESIEYQAFTPLNLLQHFESKLPSRDEYKSLSRILVKKDAFIQICCRIRKAIACASWLTDLWRK